jgi:hypothetical protein
MAGVMVDEIPYIPGEIVFEINTEHWVAGTYILAIYVDAQSPQIFKEVIVH